MVFVSKLNMKALYLDQDQNGFENVIKNVFEISYVIALRLHSLLASFYFIKKKKLPHTLYCNNLVLKISAKMQMVYLKLDLKPSAKIDLCLLRRIIKYAFQCVLKGKYSSYYQDQHLPVIKPSDVPKPILNYCIKERKTYKIISHAFQRF